MPKITFDSLKEEAVSRLTDGDAPYSDIKTCNCERAVYKLLELISWQQGEIQALTDEIKILKQKKGKNENPKTDD